MSHDGKVLARVREHIADTKRKNEATQSLRRAEVYSRVPAVRAAEAELSHLMASVATRALKKGADAGAAVANARFDSDALTKKRSELLKSAGYPADYIDEIYDCPICHDTGYVLGRPCACLEALYKIEAKRELSSMLNLGCQSFENFDLSLYDNSFDPQFGDCPRSTMSTVLEICREYAIGFGKNSVNLLFRGDTGLGKTFLSACIARVVSEKGYSVVYDTAVSVFEAFETQKFDRGGGNAEETSSRVKRYLGCDLLILDDLGTEMTTTFTISALYTLINSRLVSGKKTIISTNLCEDDARKRYSSQIVSRIEGEYISLHFAGRDIRAVKRERGLQ
ncbi:MAG: ATP-binding protein [Oscillospiraceae bacterium]